jgi:hypothetical protein
MDMLEDTEGTRTTSVPYVDRRMIAAGAVLMLGGSLVGLAGAAIGAYAMVTAGRRYLANRDEPPRETARRRWEQTRSATTAGLGAWQEYAQKTRPAVR